MAGRRQKVIRLAFDPGNREILLTDGEDTIQIDSAYAVLTGKRKPQKKDDFSSVLELDGSRYIVGHSARVQSSYTLTFEKNKYEECLKFFLVTIAQLYPDSERLTVDLDVNISESNKNSQAVQNILIGEHEFTCDDDNFKVKVNSVKCFEEGLGAWYLLNDNEPPTTGMLTGVINLGGATVDGILVDDEGDVYSDLSFHDPKGGCYALSRELRLSVAEECQDANHVSLDVYMDALKKGKNYSVYNYDYSHLVEDEVDRHFKRVIDKIKTSWQPEMKRVERIIFTGGLTYLIKDRLTNNMFRVADSPEKANTLGILGK